MERRLRDAMADTIKFFVDLENIKARTNEHNPLLTENVWGINADGE